MPTEARWFIKTSLLYLVLALLTGLALTLPAARSLAAALYPTYLHLFTVGWLTQLIVGVAFWLFPRYRRDRLFGHRWLMWATYGLLNTGLILRAATEPFPETTASHRWGLTLSALLQWLGGVLFVVYIWPRVKTK
jgi:hypothetical protein